MAKPKVTTRRSIINQRGAMMSPLRGRRRTKPPRRPISSRGELPERKIDGRR